MKRYWSLLLVLLLIPCLVVAASAEETSGKCGKNVFWEFEEATGTLTISGTGDMDEFSAVYTDNGFYSVDEEPWDALKSRIRTAVIEEGVTNIGGFAFSYCKNLTSVSIGSTVTRISWQSFQNCTALKEVVIPDSVTKIEKLAFEDCKALERITLSKNLKEIPYEMCHGCSALTQLRIPGNVDVIGESAFYSCNLKEVIIEEGVSEIGDCAFCHNDDLKTVTLPKSLEKIDSSAFYACPLETVSYGGTVADRNRLNISRAGELLAARWQCTDGVVEGTWEAPYINWVSNKGSNGKPLLDWSDTYNLMDKGYTISKYRIYRSEKATSGFKLLKTVSKPLYSYYSFMDTTAETGKTYYYKIKALDEDTGETSGFSNTVKVTCRLKPPSFSVKVNDDTGITEVRWDTVEGAVKYRVYRSTKYDGTYTRVYTGIKSRVFRDTNAKVGKTYYYKVKAVHENSEANSLTPNSYSGKRKLPTPEITVKLNSNGDPKVTWKTVKGGVKYQVYRCTTEHGTYSLVKTAKESRTFVDTKAKSGQRYYYTVRVQDSSGGWSEFAWAKSVKAK